MKLFPALMFVLLCSSIAICQDAQPVQKITDDSRDQKLAKIKDLNAQINRIVDELVTPPTPDMRQAESEGFRVFRLNPREIYGWIATPQGGGCYYSFSENSHDYQHTAQIELQQGYLSVGFAGADYGFMIDLGDKGLSEIGEETPEAKFLYNYAAPTDEPVARAEYRKLQGYEAEGFVYKNRFPTVVGHSYLLRAITFSRADILVALRVIRKDTDGSLTIYWKQLKTFDRPELKRAVQAVN